MDDKVIVKFSTTKHTWQLRLIIVSRLVGTPFKAMGRNKEHMFPVFVAPIKIVFLFLLLKQQKISNLNELGTNPEYSSDC